MSGNKQNRLVIYTGIFGGYDTLPPVEAPAPDIDYICFTDRALLSDGVWQIRTITPVLADPHRDSRRVKLLPHLFLAEYDISLWVDANFLLKEKLKADILRNAVATHPIASLRHQDRSCLYAEAEIVITGGYDAPLVVSEQVHKYKALGFPAGFGLHAGGFLVRRHNDPRCKVFCDLWWQEFVQHSRRDQLSFPFVRWVTQQEIETLPYNYFSNPLFTWGEKGQGGHKAPAPPQRYPLGPQTSADGDSLYSPEEYVLTEYLCYVHKLRDSLEAEVPAYAKMPAPFPGQGHPAVLREATRLLTTCRCPLFLGDLSPLWLHYTLASTPASSLICLSTYRHPVELATLRLAQRAFPNRIVFLTLGQVLAADPPLFAHIDGVCIGATGNPQQEKEIPLLLENSLPGTLFFCLGKQGDTAPPCLEEARKKGRLAVEQPCHPHYPLYRKQEGIT